MPTLPRLERVSDTEGEHSDDSAGEKEAKRQRSEPTTPVSTSGRLPYEYDAVMGITKVGTKEAEGFDEDFDAAEYHDAAEEPIRKDESDNAVEPQRLEPPLCLAPHTRWVGMGPPQEKLNFPHDSVTSI